MKEMNDEPKTNEDAWSVEPARKDHQRLKAVLRVALIVAALGAVALVGAALIFGNSIREQLQPVGGLIIGSPERQQKKIEYQQKKDAKIQCARAVGDNIVNRGGD